MKKILLLHLLLAQAAFAALPPFYQSKKEIEAILKSEELSKALDSADLILKIEQNEKGYLITTNKHTLQVDIAPKQNRMPGPMQFTLRFHTAIPQ